MMEEKKIVTLDLTDCKYLGEIHQKIKETFDFPDFYGANWSAFEDMIKNECGEEKIKISGEYTLSKELQQNLQVMHKILESAKEESQKYGWDFEYNILS